MPKNDSTVIWKDVPGFPGYRASSEGNVETRWVSGGNRPNGGEYPPILGNKWLPQKTSNNRGRRAFHIHGVASPTGKRRYCEVHTFVCLAFHGLPQPGQEVRHFPDPDPSNNRPSNLQWGTRAENFADRVIQGTDERGEKSPNAKLTTEKVLEMRKLKKEGWSNLALADKYGISKGNVSNILCGRAWAWLKSSEVFVSEGLFS